MRALAIDAASPEKQPACLRRSQSKQQNRNKEALGSANSFGPLNIHDGDSDPDDLDYDDEGDKIPGLVSDSDCDSDSDDEDSDGFEIISNSEVYFSPSTLLYHILIRIPAARRKSP